MGAVHDLRLRSNKFVAEIDSYIEVIIDDNKELIKLNQEQLKDEHKTALDQPITPQYSKNYADFKGFKTPDLYLTGDMFSEMSIGTTKNNQYYIDSSVDYTKKLKEQYTEKIFGIAPSKQSKAKDITTKELSKAYKQAVFSK